MTVAENVLLNNEPTMARFGIIRRKRDARAGRELLLAHTRSASAPDAVVGDLPNDLKKMVQIVKAISLQAADPAARRADLVADRRRGAAGAAADPRARGHEGVGVVFISHYLNEIFEVCDDAHRACATAQVVADQPVASDQSRPQVVTAMVGRQLDEIAARAPRRRATPRGVPVLSVEGLAIEGRLRRLSFALHRARCWASPGSPVPGLDELAKAIFGSAESRREAGVVRSTGQIVPNEPTAALAAGIALITNDRLREGILPDFT